MSDAGAVSQLLFAREGVLEKWEAGSTLPSLEYEQSAEVVKAVSAVEAVPQAVVPLHL